MTEAEAVGLLVESGYVLAPESRCFATPYVLIAPDGRKVYDAIAELERLTKSAE